MHDSGSVLVGTSLKVHGTQERLQHSKHVHKQHIPFIFIMDRF